MVDPEQLCVQPQSLGWNEIPSSTGDIFEREPQQSNDLRHPAIQLELPGNDKLTRRQLEAAVECGCQGKRSVGDEITEPTHEVLAVDREPVPFEAGVDRPHLVQGLV